MTGHSRPDGGAPTPSRRSHGGRFCASRRLPRRWRGLLLGGVWLRLSTWRNQSDLDRQLAFGVDPMLSDELSLRVGQLCSVRSRKRLACALRGAVALAGWETYPLGMPRVSIRRIEVRASRALLLELAEIIETGGPLGVEGLASTSLLIGDRRGPLYRDDASVSLRTSAFGAIVALERGHPIANTTDT